MSSSATWAWKMACWVAARALGSPTRGKPPVNSIVAVSGTTTIFLPISRRNRSAAVLFPPPGPSVSTMRKWFRPEAFMRERTITDSAPPRYDERLCPACRFEVIDGSAWRARHRISEPFFETV